MMMTTTTQSAASAKTADAGQPAQVAQAADVLALTAKPNGAAQAATAAPPAAAAQPATAAQDFAAWLNNQAQSALLPAQSDLPVDGTAAPAAARPDGDGVARDDSTGDGASKAAQPQDGALLAAMAMPLMPLSPMQVAQAVQAAQPSGTQAGAQPGDDAKPAAGAQAITASADRAVGPDGKRSAAQDQGLALPQLANAPAARPAQAETSQVVRLAVHTQAEGNANNGAQDSGAERGNSSGNTAAPVATIAGTLASQPAPNAPAADTVKLAGPPTAWRQSLQEALGERMNVQVGKGIEQAVIRLEPPQLGRIDIAIRHSAGTLEVNISATNGEVLRQLQNVSDNLRSDLSQRQFTEVAVTVAPPQKNGAAPFGDPQQGRGRQQDRGQEDQQPGRALADADNQPSGFSLSGRDHA
jgi:flagellar hook-length control protein FliK